MSAQIKLFLSLLNLIVLWRILLMAFDVKATPKNFTFLLPILLSSSIGWVRTRRRSTIQYNRSKSLQAKTQSVLFFSTEKDIPVWYKRFSNVVEVFLQCGRRFSPVWYKRFSSVVPETSQSSICALAAMQIPPIVGQDTISGGAFGFRGFSRNLIKPKSFLMLDRQKQVGWWNWLVCY